MSVMVCPYLDGGDAKEKEVRFRFQHVPFPCGKFLPFHTVCPEYEQTGTESVEKFSVQNPDQPLQFFGHDLGAYPGLRMVVFSLLLLIIMLFAREGRFGLTEDAVTVAYGVLAVGWALVIGSIFMRTRHHKRRMAEGL